MSCMDLRRSSASPDMPHSPSNQIANELNVAAENSHDRCNGRVNLELQRASYNAFSCSIRCNDETASLIDGVLYCNATHDSYLCWPPTPAGEDALQQCPPERLSDTSQYAFRRCGEDGQWLGKKPNDTTIFGWTNYTPCFPHEVQTLLKVYERNEEDAQTKYAIALATRNMEIVGFSMSFFVLGISLGIFGRYRTLRNTRTRIHKSLFGAMLLQVILRLILYLDQALFRSSLLDQYFHANMTVKGIDDMPYVCEGLYITLEYAMSVMFMWMFIEGLYLHGVVTANSLRERFSHWIFYVIGWGFPLFVTGVWVLATSHHYSQDNVKRCWYGYNFSPLYWIVQGPRLAVILINFIFLMNIMRVLIVKLRRSENSEVVKVRKAVRAAMVLLPLLGITNILNMIEPSLDGSVLNFALWSYSTHFLRSFQGFFIALIYCFMNGEVRQVLKKDLSNYRAMRADARRQQGPNFYSAIARFFSRLYARILRRRRQPDPRIKNRVPTPSKPSWVQVRQQQCDTTEAEIGCEMEMGPIPSQDAKVLAAPSTSEQETRECDLGVSVEEDA